MPSSRSSSYCAPWGHSVSNPAPCLAPGGDTPHHFVRREGTAPPTLFLVIQTHISTILSRKIHPLNGHSSGLVTNPALTGLFSTYSHFCE